MKVYFHFSIFSETYDFGQELGVLFKFGFDKREFIVSQNWLDLGIIFEILLLPDEIPYVVLVGH